MSLQINRSFAAISAGALQSYHSNQTTMGKAITRVSTGKRVNTAADDVGAYASSHRLKADSDAYNALYRGVQSGATYLNAADKAMTSIVDMLTAMREKALEYQTTSDSKQKNILQQEFEALYDAAKTAMNVNIGTQNDLLTSSKSFSFTTGIDVGDLASVDLSNAPSDVSSLTYTANSYTFENAIKNASAVTYYKAAGTGKNGTMVLGGQTFTLSNTSVTASDAAGHKITDYALLMDSNSKIVGSYKQGTAGEITLNWDVNKLGNTGYKTLITNTKITSVTKFNSGTDLATADVVAGTYTISDGKGSGSITIGAMELTMSNTGEVKGTINSDATHANGSLVATNTKTAVVGSFKADSNGNVVFTWNENAKYLVTDNGVGSNITSTTATAFASGQTLTFALASTLSGSSNDYSISDAILKYDGKSGQMVASKNSVDTTYTLDTDGYIYDADDTTQKLGVWKDVSNDTSKNLSIDWGDPDAGKLSFSVSWNAINSALKDSDGKEFTIASTDTAKALGDAVTTVVNEQAKIGGGINALEYISEHLSNLASVQDEAYTTLTEADMAAEMTSYVKSNIYSQAAQAMIAQANQSLAQVLNLLQ